MRFLLYFCLTLWAGFSSLYAQTTTRIQLIHNIPAPTIDVYVNDTRVADNLEYGTATAFFPVLSNAPVTVSIGGAASKDVSEAFLKFPFTFENGKTYLVTANGIVFGQPEAMLAFNGAARERSTNGAKTDVTFVNGAIAPSNVDVFLHKTTTKVVSNLGFGQYAPYAAYDPTVLYVDVKPTGKDSLINTYKIDLSGLAGQAVTVVVGGALNNNPAPFRLLKVEASGRVTTVPAEAPPPPPSGKFQIIQNSHTAGVVDVYINDQLVSDNLPYRGATAFLNVPVASNPIRVTIAAGNSTSSAQPIVQNTYTIEDKKEYVLYVTTPVAPATTPIMVLNPVASSTSVAPFLFDMSFFQGSPNAGNLDFGELLMDTLVPNVAFNRFSPYINLLPEVYDITVRRQGEAERIGSYRIDASTLSGKAVHLFTSGLRNGNPAFGLFAALPDGRVLTLAPTPYVRAQFVHTAPDPTMDIYAGRLRLVNDLEYRKATAFVSVPADRTLPLGIANAESQSSAGVIFKSPLSLASGKDHTVFAIGSPFDSIYPIRFVSDDRALMTAPADRVAISFFNGAKNAPSLTVSERTAGTWFSNIAYSTASAYRNERPSVYYFDVRPTTPATAPALGTYQLDATAMAGRAVRIFASGQAGNSTFGLFAALTDGTVVPLTAARAVARLQVIHNSPAAAVDVYVDTTLILNDFAFRSATPFFYAPAGDTLRVRVAPANSTSYRDAVFTTPLLLENGKTYVATATGILGNATTPLRLSLLSNAREKAQTATNLELTFLHGVPNLGPLAALPFDGRAPFINNWAFGTYSAYTTLPANILVFDIGPANDVNNFIGTWGGDFSALGGQSGVVFASGMADGTPPVDLFIALPTGQVLRLPAYARAQIIHNAPSDRVNIFMNGTPLLSKVAFRSATDVGLMRAGQPIRIAIGSDTSRTVASAFYTTELPALKTGKTYLLMATGVPGSLPMPFKIVMYEQGRDRARRAGNVDLTFFQGSPDAGALDVVEGAGNILFNDVPYGEFAKDYASVSVNNYVVRLTSATDNAATISAHRAELRDRAQEAITLFTSGFRNATGTQPSLQLWAALTNGNTYPLPISVSTHTPIVGQIALAPNPAQHQVQITLPTDSQGAGICTLVDASGRVVLTKRVNETSGLDNISVDLSALPTGQYMLLWYVDKQVHVAPLAIQR